MDINEDAVKVDEADEGLMGSLEALVLHEGRILGESEKETMYICILKQGFILGEDDSDEEDADEGFIGSLIDYLENEDQHEEMMPRASNEATRPCDFETDNLGVNASLVKNGGQSLEIVTKMKNNGQNLNSVISGEVEEMPAQSIEAKHD